jgi:hypothetical protein
MRTYTTVNEFKGFPAGYQFKWDGMNYVASERRVDSDDNGEVYSRYELAYSPDYMDALERQGYVTCGRDAVNPVSKENTKIIGERDFKFRKANDAINIALDRFLTSKKYYTYKFNFNTISEIGIEKGFDTLINNAELKFKKRIKDIITSKIKPADLNLDNVYKWVQSVFGEVTAESLFFIRGKEVSFIEGAPVRDFINGGIAMIIHELTIKLIGQFIDYVGNAVDELKNDNACCETQKS